MTPPSLGIRANLAQFSLLVVVNAFVGAMVGMERTILPSIAEEEFHLEATVAILSFIVVFGVSKALTNYLAGRLSDVVGRKRVLVGGWLVAAPVPFLLMWAPSWSWVLFANLLLGISQGLTWSTTVIMKIDLAGPKNRGLAMGLNEFAGYLAVAGSALATGYISARWGLRPEPFYLGVAYVLFGLGLSAVLVRETHQHVKHEAKLAGDHPPAGAPTQREVFWRTTLTDRELSSVTQAGLVNNLNDGMAWGLFPLIFTTAKLGLAEIGWLVALYPAVWGASQLVTGALSDRVGRKWLIAGGMLVQAFGIATVASGSTIPAFVLGQVLLGLGTAMVYPTILAAIGDVAHPSSRASAVGVYRRGERGRRPARRQERADRSTPRLSRGVGRRCFQDRSTRCHPPGHAEGAQLGCGPHGRAVEEYLRGGPDHRLSKLAHADSAEEPQAVPGPRDGRATNLNHVDSPGAHERRFDLHRQARMAVAVAVPHARIGRVRREPADAIPAERLSPEVSRIAPNSTALSDVNRKGYDGKRGDERGGNHRAYESPSVIHRRRADSLGLNETIGAPVEADGQLGARAGQDVAQNGDVSGRHDHDLERPVASELSCPHNSGHRVTTGAAPGLS